MLIFIYENNVTQMQTTSHHVTDTFLLKQKLLPYGSGCFLFFCFFFYLESYTAVECVTVLLAMNATRSMKGRFLMRSILNENYTNVFWKALSLLEERHLKNKCQIAFETISERPPKYSEWSDY